MNVILGNPAVEGIGIGSAFVVPNAVKRLVPQKNLLDGERENDWQRYENSVKKISQEIRSQLLKISGESKNEKIQREIFETYLLMLDDPEFTKDLRIFFESSGKNIEFALDKKTNEYADKLRNSGNEYLSERAQDICDIFGRVLDDLLDFKAFNTENAPDGAVIVATSLKPSDTIVLAKRKIAGLALTEGGVSSHVAILARTYGIPTVFALHKIVEAVKSGETVIVDGNSGEALINPDEKTICEYRKKRAQQEQAQNLLKNFRDKKTCTKDGTEFFLYANIGTVEEAKIAQQEGADGIGLFRTEFLFMGAEDGTKIRSLSHSEEQQFLAYKTVLQIMGQKPVTIRTLDSGGDKLISASDFIPSESKNPLLGLRAIRLSLRYPQQLKTQFRALYRASVYGNLRIMLPLITGVEQIERAKEIAKEAQRELSEKGIPFNPNVPIGVMIETAAAAMISDCLAKKAAFFSLGTNDLTQYTLGIDREDTEVSQMYNEFHLAVLRLIQKTIGSARTEGIPISVCGEMAGRKESVLILGGMGVRALSMGAKQLLSIKKLLSEFDINEMRAISSKSLNLL